MTDQIIAVTVVGDDRPGIVADVTSALADLHGNLEDSTMTLLRGHFAMVVLVRTGADAPAVEQALAHLTGDGSLVISARRLSEQTAVAAGGEADFVLHVHGADRTGIVAAITRVVADHGVNIVDLGTRLGDGLYVLVAQLSVPSSTEPDRLAEALRSVAADLGVEVRLSRVDDDLL
ncbi:glycine cleavage system protein R [Segeticoccus rhizosphaerae]|uniref:glycine cleavage system protein R n=1 Tax=Segeticoccus rhizosphaerae TaxID=1104777 RepID=UPI00192E68A0|nr:MULTISPECIES: ACT domain-containing protein [Intrasporangiaceae]